VPEFENNKPKYKNLVIFLTHNFLPNFLNQLKKIDKNFADLDVIVLFDNESEFTISENYFEYIEIIKINKIKSTYDSKGHTLYLSYFQKHSEKMYEYKYYWIIENDVHINCGIKFFIDKHDKYDYDVLVAERGVRDLNWSWTSTLSGFDKNYNIGVSAVCIRFSDKFLQNLIYNIDKIYYGYLEAIIPHICKKYGFSINTYLPELIGIINVYGGPLIEKIKKDILNNTQLYIENKLYHPIKL
jgi:hypothetical protein